MQNQRSVSSEASLNAPEHQEKLRAVVDPLPEAELKAVATELGARASRGKASIVSAIVEQVTGLKPATRRVSGGPRKSAIDQAAVQQEAVKLKGLLEKSLDPGGLSSAELDGAMSDLQPRSSAELQAIAKEVGVEKGARGKEGILKRIREKLREVERARESIQV